ncbi:MAG: GyrI-like domain-containing protein [Hyphomicrobiales bacterium]
MTSPRLAASIALAAALALSAASPSFAQNPPAKDAPAPPPAATPAPPAAAQPSDPFGEEVTLTEKTVIYIKGHANWDTAFETLVDAFKSLNQYLDKQKITPNGPAMTVYTQTDDTGFSFQASLPVPAPPKVPPKGDIAVGKSPSGKAYKFVHRGSFDAMDTTYEAITNFLDEKRIEAKDLFIEEYVSDPVKTTEDKLIVNVYVPAR